MNRRNGSPHGRAAACPREAEWEFAARSGGKEQTYPCGDGAPTCERAVLKDCGSGTAPVCSTPLGNTKQGLCDMAGNVWEWVEDWYHESYQGVPSDGSAWIAPAGAYRVMRGGSFFYDGAKLKAGGRGFGDPDYRRGDFGFRLARPANGRLARTSLGRAYGGASPGFTMVLGVSTGFGTKTGLGTGCGRGPGPGAGGDGK